MALDSSLEIYLPVISSHISYMAIKVSVPLRKEIWTTTFYFRVQAMEERQSTVVKEKRV